jgi:rod shape-determining protein MreD
MYFAMLMFMVMLGATLLQAALPGWPVLGYARFPILLGVVLYYALNHKLWIVVIAAFSAGMLQDSMSFVPLGYSSFLFCVAAVAVGRYRQLVLSDAIVTAIFFGGIAGFTVTLALYLLLKAGGHLACSGGTAALHIFGSTFLGIITVPAVFLLMTLMHRALELQEKEDADVRA